jgi:Phosphoinositide phospholipase C, Ca2+-dependent
MRMIRRSLVRRCLASAAGLAAAVALLLGTPSPAGAADGATKYSAATGVGMHNAYDKAKYPYFADALDSGASLVELDVWTYLGNWMVRHDLGGSNDNNCENASSAADLRVKGVNQSFAGCLADLKAWHNAHPGHRPIVVKVELKNGFEDNDGLGPDEFDALVASKLGGAVFRPADLRGGYANLDAAAQADNWPTRAQMAGKFIFELIPGTVEEDNPFDSLWTDREYATYLRNLASAGTLSKAMAFPAVHNAQTGDPRTRYSDTTIRPWFVFFDGDASQYVSSVDTSWYDQRHYILIMTDAQKVPPAIDSVHPTQQQALDRVNLLAHDHASLATSDWYPLPTVLSTVVDRG